VDKVTFEVLKRDVSRQEHQYGFDAALGEVGLVPVPPGRCDGPCLDDGQIRELAELAKRIEQRRGAPQDIEWAVSEAGDVHVLQVRPETVWSQRQAEQLVTERRSAVSQVLARFAGVGVASDGGRPS
jgi:pyruvate,water dikinase